MNWLDFHKQLLQLARTNETLTPSQVSARDAILNAIEMWEKYINLWGDPGVGKTFLAHFLHHRADLVYFSDWTRYNVEVSGHSAVAIDNAPHTRQEARSLYDKLRWGQKDYAGPANVILITREPINDAAHRISLRLTDSDIAHIENLMRKQFGEADFESISQHIQQRSGLWSYIKILAQGAI